MRTSEMPDETLGQLIAGHYRATDGPEATGEHAGFGTIMDLVMGRLDDTERPAVLDHLMECGQCRRSARQALEAVRQEEADVARADARAAARASIRQGWRGVLGATEAWVADLARALAPVTLQPAMAFSATKGSGDVHVTLEGKACTLEFIEAEGLRQVAAALEGAPTGGAVIAVPLQPAARLDEAAVTPDWFAANCLFVPVWPTGGRWATGCVDLDEAQAEMSPLLELAVATEPANLTDDYTEAIVTSILNTRAGGEAWEAWCARLHDEIRTLLPALPGS